jgi:hypothetical protein
MLDHYRLPHAEDAARARRMIRKVAIAMKELPSELFIAGVHSCDKYPTFSGGFADVYRAWYKGEMVALKRIRTFQSSPKCENLVLSIIKHKAV